MAHLSRRSTLKSIAAAAAGAGITLHAAPRAAQAAVLPETENTWGHTEDLGAQYYERMTGILESIRRTEMNLVGDLTTRMADAIKAGNVVWLQAHEGHMGRFENDEANPGNPRIMRSLGVPAWGTASRATMASLKKGDIFVTNHVTQANRDARERGVYVVGVPVCYVDNEWVPRGFMSANPNNWLLGDVTNVILQSYIPYTQGIVDCPEIPEMKICPSSSNALYTIFWMLQCEVANKVKNKDAKPLDKSQVVIDTIIGRIHEIYRTQKDYIFDNAPTVAKMIGRGSHFYVTSDNPGVQEESNRVAMGPMMTNEFREVVRFDGKVMGTNDMRKGDVHLFASNVPDSPKIIEEIKKAKEMGMFTVAIASANSYGIRSLADVFIDDLNPEGAGFMEIKGFSQRVGSLGSVLNNTITWMFTAQVIDEMVRRGWVPWFNIGAYVNGGGTYNTVMRPFFLKQGF
jgi:uncharacterized phosphosugar-binding protein